MPSKSGPCPCPSCRGVTRSARVRRAHAAEQTRILAEQAEWHRAYESAVQQAITAQNETSSSESSESESSAEHLTERLSKRPRVEIEENQLGSETRVPVCLFVFNVLFQFIYTN